MKQKPKTDEYRMKASEFDKMMRRALATGSAKRNKAEGGQENAEEGGP